MKKNSKVVIIFLSLMIFLVSVLGAVTTSVFELDFYTKSQSKHQVAEKLNLSQQQVTEATIVSLLYTKGLVKDLVYNTEIDGEVVDLYSKQDKEHMIDVKNLYAGAYYVLLAGIVGIFISMLTLVFLRKSFNTFSLTLLFNKVSFYALVFVGVVALFAFVSFDQFWTFFHKIFFRNDLWLMDYNKDLLVNIFPAGLFMDLVFKIIFRFFAIFGLANLTAYGYRLASMRRLKVND